VPELGYSTDQAAIWFEQASDLQVAAHAIKRESVNGHLFIDPPLSAEQITQRQAVLGIAHAVIESARKRALTNFHLIQHSETCEKNTLVGS
jgi:hypothetical protein